MRAFISRAPPDAADEAASGIPSAPWSPKSLLRRNRSSRRAARDADELDGVPSRRNLFGCVPDRKSTRRKRPGCAALRNKVRTDGGNAQSRPKKKEALHAGSACHVQFGEPTPVPEEVRKRTGTTVPILPGRIPRPRLRRWRSSSRKSSPARQNFILERGYEHERKPA